MCVVVSIPARWPVSDEASLRTDVRSVPSSSVVFVVCRVRVFKLCDDL